MGLLIECPSCRKRNSPKAEACKCGLNFKKTAHKTYWIEYYIYGKRRRERIGSKLAAENRLRKVLTQRAEDRYVDTNKNARITFDQLAAWYLALPGVKAKKSYQRDICSIKRLSSFYSGKLVKDITPNSIEAYRKKRRADPPVRATSVAPATLNREVVCLNRILNLAEQEGIIDHTPLKRVKLLKEHNIRNRVISHEEYLKIIEHCPKWLAQVVAFGYFTAMRAGEIQNLTWNKIDLKNGIVRLEHGDTKTDEGRIIPLHPELIKMLKSMPRSINGYVFTINGRRPSVISTPFRTACKKAKVRGVTFHTLRHTCINNWRLQGHDFFRIMAASGHKTMSVFKRYHTVEVEEIKKLVKEG